MPYDIPAMLKQKLKKAAGADTTAAGEPDYAKMFNSFILQRVLKAKKKDPTKMGAKPEGKGLLVSNEGVKD